LLKASRVPGNNLYDVNNILLAPSAQEGLPVLLDLVRDAELRDTATDIIRNLSNYAYARKDQLPQLKKFVQDEDRGVRCVAAWVVYCGRAVELKEVITIQQEALKATDPWARRQAAQFLGALGSNARDAVPALSAVLEDKDEAARKAAAEALKKIQQK
jgi:HEAT repeat protein